MVQRVIKGAGGGSLTHEFGLTHTASLQKHDVGLYYGVGLSVVSKDGCTFNGGGGASPATIENAMINAQLAGTGSLKR